MEKGLRGEESHRPTRVITALRDPLLPLRLIQSIALQRTDSQFLQVLPLRQNLKYVMYVIRISTVPGP